LDIAITPEDIAGPPAGRWPFLQTLGWGVLIILLSTLIQGLMFVAFAAVDLYARHYLSNLSRAYIQEVLVYEGGRGAVIFSTIIVSDLLCVAAILLIVVLKRQTLQDYLSVYRVRPSVLFKWIGAVGGFVILTNLAAGFFHLDFGGEGMAKLYVATQPAWLFWAAAIIAAPIFEEVMFRGFLFRGFQASFLGTSGAIGLTAVLWAALHLQYNLYGIAFIALTGILFGLARVRTGSLIVPLILHALLNFSDMVAYSLSGVAGP
jgi:uncharacterized protein